MSDYYEERFKNIEEKLDRLLAHKDDIKTLRKILNLIKKNKKYLRFSIDVLLLISTIIGFLL